jgi:hypothetical protein
VKSCKCGIDPRDCIYHSVVTTQDKVSGWLAIFTVLGEVSRQRVDDLGRGERTFTFYRHADWGDVNDVTIYRDDTHPELSVGLDCVVTHKDRVEVRVIVKR